MDTPPQTQARTGSQRSYLWVILFTCDLDNEYPFICLSLDHFKGTDFPWQLITGHLGLSDRLEPRHLSGLPGQKYCVFAKVEEGNIFLNFFLKITYIYKYIFLNLLGTTNKRRNDEVTRLNGLYNEILPVKKSIQKCLKNLCQKVPYRMLKDWTYETNANPFESDTPPRRSNVSDDEDLENIDADVLSKLSQELNPPKKKRLLRKKAKKTKVNVFFWK